ncbi:hypothetical protein ACIQZB_36605 [Streptomyces sp. NPDC097727]|uniref:hypothetical protein n=1 Tax=Streptomyces sp. NPDC097727 TaxID=3366092 RepID=UPI0038088479
MLFAESRYLTICHDFLIILVLDDQRFDVEVDVLPAQTGDLSGTQAHEAEYQRGKQTFVLDAEKEVLDLDNVPRGGTLVGALVLLACAARDLHVLGDVGMHQFPYDGFAEGFFQANEHPLGRRGAQSCAGLAAAPAAPTSSQATTDSTSSSVSSCRRI